MDLHSVTELHREAYLHVLRESGVADHHAEVLYSLMIDPLNWTPYPDTADVLTGLHRQGIKTAVVSNIAFDVRPAFVALGVADRVDEFVLSFEIGAVKPDAAIFEAALVRLDTPGPKQCPRSEDALSTYGTATASNGENRFMAKLDPEGLGKGGIMDFIGRKP